MDEVHPLTTRDACVYNHRIINHSYRLTGTIPSEIGTLAALESL
jgi:hypothetical protein